MGLHLHFRIPPISRIETLDTPRRKLKSTVNGLTKQDEMKPILKLQNTAATSKAASNTKLRVCGDSECEINFIAVNQV
jgi:hypothetical protein